MKVVIYNKKDIVTQVLLDIHDPKIDKEKGIITHNNGKVLDLKDDDRNFLILEEHVPVKVGNVVTGPLKDYDQSHRFDSFTFDDVTRKIEEVGQEIKEEVKELLDKDDDNE